MNKFLLGRKKPVFDSRTLLFGSYLKAGLPAPPDAANYGNKVKTWPMYLNDQYGDCTIAAVGHLIQDWTANAGKEIDPTDNEILKFYEHFTTPGPENGCNMLEVLKYWRSNGFGPKGDKITAFAQLEIKNPTEAKDAVSMFGGCYLGLALPDFAVAAGQDISKIPWVVPPSGPVGNAAPDQNNGHCVCGVAYDARNLYVVTWGAIKSMSWQFYNAYCDESYAMLSNDFLTDGKAPDGFNVAQLQADLKEITSIPALRARIHS